MKTAKKSFRNTKTLDFSCDNNKVEQIMYIGDNKL